MSKLDEQILSEQQLARQFVERQGLVINTDNADFQRDLLRVYEEVQALFHIQLEQVGFRYLYTWAQSVQKVERFRICDGYSSYSTNPSTGQRVSSIGISCAAIARGHDYAVLVLLHELTHLLVPHENHTQTFHMVLDDSIGQYNARYGTHIENDYFGLPTTTSGHTHKPMRHVERVELIPIPSNWPR